MSSASHAFVSSPGKFLTGDVQVYVSTFFVILDPPHSPRVITKILLSQKRKIFIDIRKFKENAETRIPGLIFMQHINIWRYTICNTIYQNLSTFHHQFKIKFSKAWCAISSYCCVILHLSSNFPLLNNFLYYNKSSCTEMEILQPSLTLLQSTLLQRFITSV